MCCIEIVTRLKVWARERKFTHNLRRLHCAIILNKQRTHVKTTNSKNDGILVGLQNLLARVRLSRPSYSYATDQGYVFNITMFFCFFKKRYIK